VEQATDFLTTPSDDSLRIDIPYLQVLPTQHIPRQAPQEPFTITDAGCSGHSESMRWRPAGVYMKLQNIKAHDTEYPARGKRGLSSGNQREQQVWKDFTARPAELHPYAEKLRLFIQANIQVGDIADDDGMESEGRFLTRVHKSYERSSANRQKKLRDFQKLNNGRLFCECCAFDFERTYGKRGRGFIECHHAPPVSRLVPNQRLSLSDLRLLCANCHRMIHASRPWLSVEELAAALKTRKRLRS